ncbi:DUF624 domain-containing protein [Protaetiibacter larvae]|uniref:DUF624 domain-containing protein n=1 Tax=Protaetiibacter larvae TaxID=2592654 RepID=A0A5C1Y7R5_9MICO|nr:DUF624 domain-containing protein [Protaetiibacter larvae]QEO08962.1 DUF624 domain-containing protein [Protaetiibacter larvae]
MTNQAGSPDPRAGILGRVTGVVYALVLVELGFLLAMAPGFAGLAFLERDLRNLPFFALCLVPVGPAFSAALYALHASRRADDMVVWPRFWRGWVRALRDVLPLWIPALLAGTVLAYNVLLGPTVGIESFLIIGSWIVLAALVLWTVNVLVIGSLFSFRLRDTARLALFYLAARPLVTLGSASLAVLAAGTAFLTAEWVLALAASLFAAAVLFTQRPLIADVSDRFVANPGASGEPPTAPAEGSADQ